MNERYGHFLLLLVVFLLLSACASTPHEGPATPVQRELEDMLATTQAEVPAVPDYVSDVLLPELGSVIDEYDPAVERFDIAVRDLPARDFYQALVKDTPFNMIVHPELKGTVSLELKSVTLDEVLDLTRDLYGYEFRRDGMLYRVMPGGIRTEIFKINYLNISRHGGSEIQVSAGQVTNAGPSGQGGSNATRGNSSSPESGSQQGSRGIVGTRITTESKSNFWGQLQHTLSVIVGKGDGRSVVTAPESGVVVVRAMPEELRTVADYLERTELSMQRQVVLEAKILEIMLDDGYQQGISWQHISEFTRDVDSGGFIEKFLVMNQAGQSVTNPGLEGAFAASLRINDFDALIELLETQGNVQVLSSPRIATVNNQKAVIKVGSDEFFVTEIRVDENNNVNSTNTTNTDVELTPFFSGIALDVTPQISEDGRIVLHVHPSISEVADQTKVVSLGDRDLTLPLALSTIRETDSVISAMSGQVVVIGGLISDVRRNNRSSVPGVGRMPLLGGFFSQKTNETRKSELVILLKPIIANPETMKADLRRTSERFNQLSSGWE